MRVVSLGVVMIAAMAAAEEPASLVTVREAIAVTAPKKVKFVSLAAKDGAVTVRGVAASYETVAIFMRSLTNLVRTPRGYAQLVERRGHTVMVQLLAPNSGIEEMPAASLLGFKVELLRTDSVSAKASDVSFELKVLLKFP
jgi:Fimbrial assembly protein (PilN)